MKKPITKLTPAQIKKANAKRVAEEMNLSVADSKELWLDLYNMYLPLVLGDDAGRITVGVGVQRIKVARALADEALSEYENRWIGERIGDENTP